MKEKREIPFEVYWLITSIIFQLDTIFKECKVSPEQLLVLTYIKYQGGDYRKGKVMLRGQITKLLKTSYRIQDAMISKILYDMITRRLLADTVLTNDEKSQFFGTTSGRKRALLLLPLGLKKIEEIDGKFRKLIEERIKSSGFSAEQLNTEEIIKILAGSKT